MKCQMERNRPMLNKFFLMILLSSVFSGYVAVAEETNRNSATKASERQIVFKLNTEQEITEALNAILKVDKPFYDKLISLRQKDEKEFKSRLQNRYFALLQKEKLLAMKKPRVKSYRELVKESEIRFSDLRNRLKKMTDETERSKVKAEIAKASEERFEIEFNFLKYRANKAKAYADVLQNKVSDFETKKQKYIERLTNKNS